MLMIRASSTVNNSSCCTISTLQKALTFPTGSRRLFELDMSDEECQAEFRFYKNDVSYLMEVLGFPETFTCYNGSTVDGTEALCISYV